MAARDSMPEDAPPFPVRVSFPFPCHGAHGSFTSTETRRVSGRLSSLLRCLLLGAGPGGCGRSCDAVTERSSLLLLLSAADGLCSGWGVPGLLILVGRRSQDLAPRQPTLASSWSREDARWDEVRGLGRRTEPEPNSRSPSSCSQPRRHPKVPISAEKPRYGEDAKREALPACVKVAAA